MSKKRNINDCLGETDVKGADGSSSPTKTNVKEESVKKNAIRQEVKIKDKLDYINDEKIDELKHVGVRSSSKFTLKAFLDCFFQAPEPDRKNVGD